MLNIASYSSCFLLVLFSSPFFFAYQMISSPSRTALKRRKSLTEHLLARKIYHHRRYRPVPPRLRFEVQSAAAEATVPDDATIACLCSRTSSWNWPLPQQFLFPPRFAPTDPSIPPPTATAISFSNVLPASACCFKVDEERQFECTLSQEQWRELGKA